MKPAPAPTPLPHRVGVVVVHPEPAHHLHAVRPALVEQDPERLRAGIQQRQEAAVLQPRVVVEAGAAPVGGPALGVHLLDEQVRAGRGDVVDPVAQVRLRDRVGKVAAGDQRRIAHVEQPPLAARGRPLRGRVRGQE